MQTIILHNILYRIEANEAHRFLGASSMLVLMFAFPYFVMLGSIHPRA